MLLATGRCDINAVDGWNGNTTLMVATIMNWLEGVKVLLSNRVDISVRNHDGHTALNIARIYKIECIELLEEAVITYAHLE